VAAFRTSSSISSSEPRVWRRFLAWLLATALGVLAVVYGFVAIVDPWGVLPLSPPLPRVPISTNARFSFPALARSPAFDSAVFGTSTSRLLDPAVLDPLFGVRFANLAMNSATAYEQSRLLDVFARAHPHARMVIIGLDSDWCTPAPERTTGRPFPAWMYGRSPWRGYREIANLYAVQEAANQLAAMAGLKRRRYGLDGYTNFLPDDAAYDPRRVAEIFASVGDVSAAPPVPGVPIELPTMRLLADDLAALPATTKKLLFFVPYHVSQQGQPGSAVAAWTAACKRAVVSLATAVPETAVMDFMIPSDITSHRDNYWDPLHYRLPIAHRLMRDLAAGHPTPDAAVLVGQR